MSRSETPPPPSLSLFLSSLYILSYTQTDKRLWGMGRMGSEAIHPPQKYAIPSLGGNALASTYTPCRVGVGDEAMQPAAMIPLEYTLKRHKEAKQTPHNQRDDPTGQRTEQNPVPHTGAFPLPRLTGSSS
eukprot:gene3924-2792_t